MEIEVAERENRLTPSLKCGTVVVQPGQPLQFTELEESEKAGAASAVGNSVGVTLREYMRAARALLEGKYKDHRELAPPHMRESCDVFAMRCPDGMLVRYDLSRAKAMVRCAESSTSLREVAPPFSEQLIHFPEDPLSYVPPIGGPELVLTLNNSAEGKPTEIERFRPLVYAKTTLPDGFKMPLPPARPPCLVSIPNEFDLQMQGTLVPSDEPFAIDGPNAQDFIARSSFRLPVGWQVVEIYPVLGDEYWKPEYAPMWAELDLLAVIAQKNATASRLNGVDSRGALRKFYANLLAEFGTLLTGPEEPVHQFLKQHPELLCPTHERSWSKLPFGDRVSDFVFREPHYDYQLVEIEAPIRELFRKDGQQREELTHALNQISDWIQYLANNKKRVEEELGLTGISTNPRTLVVIGRSASLTEENCAKLATLQAQQNKLRILTYDDLLATARANLERLLGPLDLQGQNIEFFYYKEPPQRSR